MAIAALVSACSESADNLPRVVMPGPGPLTNADIVAANAKCERCHQGIAKEWRGSRHHLAATNEQYRAAYAVEPLVFCQTCHAPGAAHGETDGPLAELGIGCISCHPPLDGAPLSGTSHHSLITLSHAVHRSAEYSIAGACASCHEFEFPPEGRDALLLMQRTVTEHANSPFAQTSCADCHMPVVGSIGQRHRSHAFASTRDVTRLRDAVRVQVTRAEQTLEFCLELNRVGHAFPTGDLFRRVTVEASALDASGTVKSEQRRYLTRHYARQRQSNGGLALVEVADDRLGVDGARGSCETCFTLDLGAKARNLRLTYSIAYERVQHLTRGSEDLAEVAERVVLSEGNR